MDALEQDALQVLALARSLKNSLAPINRVPVEVLSLLPDYCDKDCANRVLITLTHVCHGWRETFISRSSLWTRLDFLDVRKIQTYIQRSNSSPLDFQPPYTRHTGDLVVALFPVIQHIHRLKSLVFTAAISPNILGQLRSHAPLLEVLDIHNFLGTTPILDNTLFGGNLSSLRELSLSGSITHIPRHNWVNLRVFRLSRFEHEVTVTQFLDFLESAPLLDTVAFELPPDDQPSAPPARIVPLPRLNTFILTAYQPPSILLKHLSIPIGASLEVRHLIDLEFPLQDYLPETSPNLTNLSQITTVNLRFNDYQKFLQLSGPSGSLRLLDEWRDWEPLHPIDNLVLRSLGSSILSVTQKLTVSSYAHSKPVEMEECPIFQTLSSMNNLRTLVLSECNIKRFILALNPEKNPSRLVLCPRLQEFALYTSPSCRQPYTRRLIKMAKNRASRGAKLSLITVVDLCGSTLMGEVFELREYVTRVDYRVGSEAPKWDDIPGEGGVVVGG